MMVDNKTSDTILTETKSKEHAEEIRKALMDTYKRLWFCVVNKKLEEKFSIIALSNNGFKIPQSTEDELKEFVGQFDTEDTLELEAPEAEGSIGEEAKVEI